MENIPRTGSFVMTPNHVSFLDPPAAGAFVRRKLSYIGKPGLFKNRFFGWYMRKIRCIPVKSDSPFSGGMKQIIRDIREGTPVVVFPEGTRGDGASFLEPESGAAYLALKFNIPVIPVYIKGSEKALPRGARFIRRARIKVFYGKPKRYRIPEGADKEDAYRQVSRSIMEEIGKLKDEHGARD